MGCVQLWLKRVWITSSRSKNFDRSHDGLTCALRLRLEAESRHEALKAIEELQPGTKFSTIRDPMCFLGTFTFSEKPSSQPRQQLAFLAHVSWPVTFWTCFTCKHDERIAGVIKISIAISST